MDGLDPDREVQNLEKERENDAIAATNSPP